MILIDKAGREVEVAVCGSCDEPEIVEASFVDGSGEDVSDETLDYLIETYPMELSEAAFQHQIGQAEDWADSLMDR